MPGSPRDVVYDKEQKSDDNELDDEAKITKQKRRVLGAVFSITNTIFDA
jgi:hypothetical protein